MEAQAALCQQVIETGNPIAQQAALRCAYLPQQPAQRALFFLVTEQWDAYQALDFDHRLLNLAYQAALPALRQRILEKIRRGGQTELLSAIAGKDFRSRIATLSETEAAALVQILGEGQAWEKLWASLTELPYPAAVEAVRALDTSGWEPQTEDERALLNRLAGLAQNKIVVNPEMICSLLPPAVKRARIKLAHGRLNDLSFAPGQALLAIATSRKKVIIWNLAHGQVLRTLDGFSHALGQIAYCGDGRLLVAERSYANHIPCSLYQIDGQQTIELWDQAGPVAALAPVGARQALMAGRDHSLTLLDLDQPQRPIRRQGLATWARGIRLSPSGDSALILEEGLSLMNIPELNLIKRMDRREFSNLLPRQAAFIQAGMQLCVGFSDGRLRTFSLPHWTQENDNLEPHASPVLALENIFESPIWVSACTQGEVRFHAWPNSTSLGKIDLAVDRLNALRISQAGTMLAVCDDQSNLHLWDLRPLQIPEMLNQPLALSSPNQIGALSILVEHGQLDPGIHQALRFILELLRFRFRYDVELAEAGGIQAGEFDIDIQ